MGQILKLVKRVYPVGTTELVLESNPAIDARDLFFHLIPVHDFRIFRINEMEVCEPITACQYGNRLVLHCYLDDEQEYILRAYTQTTKEQIFEAHLYALEQDILALRPVLGDFHIHTTRSDGQEPPETVAANYCSKGIEIVAITDHYTPDGSIAAIEYFHGASLPILLLYGEEVHTCQKNHVVSLGTTKSLNQIYRENPEAFEAEVRMLEETLTLPKGINSFEAASHHYISCKLRELGAFSILAHPFWRPNALHMDPKTTSYLLREQLYDAFELFGGMGPNENAEQLSLYHDLLLEGIRLPIVSSSDSHSSGSTDLFTPLKTILFLREKSLDGVTEAILQHRTVAVYHYPGEHYCNHGTLRQVSYANFLMEQYFPEMAQQMKKAARLMRVYPHCAADELNAATAEAEAVYHQFFGLEASK